MVRRNGHVGELCWGVCHFLYLREENGRYTVVSVAQTRRLTRPLRDKYG